VDGEQREKLRQFYATHLEEQITPFWVQRGLDRECGGFFTCFDNTGRELAGTDKYVWSQGRFVDVLAATAEWTGQASPYLDLAKQGVDFLRHHAFLTSGNCAFLLTREGEPKERRPGEGYELSTFADCFVAGGLASFASAAADKNALAEGIRLYDSICRRIDVGTFKTEPYPLPAGYRSQAVPMIALRVGEQLAVAAKRLGDTREQDLLERCDRFAEDIWTEFVAGGLLFEARRPRTNSRDALLERYVNPGHTMECAWFLIHHALRRGRQEKVERASGLIARAFALGWDDEHGGLLQYVDRDGGRPKGAKAARGAGPMVAKLRGDWDNKLWWVHAEALYATALAGMLTGDPALWDAHETVRAYTLATFPNPDRRIGEWIQTHDRRGRPVEKVTALPVKDPMHIWRALLLLVRLLSGERPWRG